MKNVRLTIEYEGTAYAGWQWQPGERTIQGEITEAIRKVTGQDVKLIGAGRTDAGVHALGQVANFKVEHRLVAERFRDAINYYLDDDIRITASIEVDDDFHARFSARNKRYRYLVSRRVSAVYRNLHWPSPQPLDFDLLGRAAEIVVGDHDFSPFCVVSSLKDNNRCTIEHARWHRMGETLVFEIRGNRFLHNMVRSLVGAMVNLGTMDQDRNKRNLTLDRFKDIIHSSVEERVVFTAPARGLYLVSVGY